MMTQHCNAIILQCGKKKLRWQDNSYKVLFKVVFHLHDIILKLWGPLSQLLLNTSIALTIFKMLPKPSEINKPAKYNKNKTKKNTIKTKTKTKQNKKSWYATVKQVDKQ